MASIDYCRLIIENDEKIAELFASTRKTLELNIRMAVARIKECTSEAEAVALLKKEWAYWKPLRPAICQRVFAPFISAMS